MNTCSNCGAAVRPGAKFCTACGTRLNDVSASTATSEWTAGQPAPDTTRVVEVSDAASASPTPDGAPIDPTAANGFSASDPVPAPGTSEDESPPTSSWSWRSSPSDPASSAPAQDDGEEVTTEASSGAESRVFIVDKRDEAPASTSAPSNTADTDVSNEEFTWTWGTPDNPEPAADDGPDASITASKEVTTLATDPDAQTENLTGDDEDISASRSGDSWNAENPSGDDANSTVSAPENRTLGTHAVNNGDADPASEPDTGQVQRAVFSSAEDSNPDASSGEPAATAADEDPLDRARRLVEELRTLIPPPRPYQEDAPQAVSASVERLRDELESVRSTSDFGDLRSALESARERPRDVDTMLGMVGRIDSMLDALDDRDRLASAVDRALDQLQRDARPESLDRS